MRSRAQTIAIILSKYKKKMGSSRSFAAKSKPPADPRSTAERDYPLINGDTVDGRDLYWKDERTRIVSNTDSISATLDDDWTELKGLREVPMTLLNGDSEFNPKRLSYSTTESDRIRALAATIRDSNAVEPVIVVVDKEGPYVLEGGHRYTALRLLGAKSIPALVILDTHDPVPVLPKRKAKHP